MEDCEGPLHPAALEGIRLFNRGEYFEAHEALEEAWRAETGAIRDLYRGILQIAVAYLHITRNNYHGAVKVYGRSQKWIRDWPGTCRGIQVGQLRKNAEAVLAEAQRLGPAGLDRFDVSLMKPIDYEIPGPLRPADRQAYTCDRCGTTMFERNCKVICPNCGNRFDCSDLNLYFD